MLSLLGSLLSMAEGKRAEHRDAGKDKGASGRRRTSAKKVIVSDEVWDAAQARAQLDGTSVSAVVRDFLAEYAGLDPSRGLHGRSR